MTKIAIPLRRTSPSLLLPPSIFNLAARPPCVEFRPMEMVVLDGWGNVIRSVTWACQNCGWNCTNWEPGHLVETLSAHVAISHEV